MCYSKLNSRTEIRTAGFLIWAQSPPLINYIATDQTEEQIIELYNSGKEVVLEIAAGEENAIRALYNGTLFYSINAIGTTDTIGEIDLSVFGEPIIDGQRTIWIMGDFTIANQ